MKALRNMLLIVTAAMLIVAASPAVAQDWAGSGRVKGVVTDQDGKPVAGATVIYRMLKDPESGPPDMVTNKKGKFSMLGLKGGTWTVRVEAEGYYPWTSPTPVEVFSTGISPTVEAELEPLPKEALVAEGRAKANEFLKAGDSLMEAGDAAGARAKYERALDVVDESDYPVIYTAIANTYLAEGNLESAEATADQALAVDQEWVEALKVKCAIAAAEGRLDEAEALLAEIPEDEVMHQNTLVNLGLAHFNQGEMDAAMGYFDRTLRDHPEFGQVYYFRGLANLNLNQADAARADFERFLELEPDSPQAAEAQEYIGYLTQEGGGS
jgi:Flp pilus assembly protein TadD